MFVTYRVELSRKQKMLLFTFSVIVGISLFCSIGSVLGANVQDYLTVANANASIADTFTYGSYFYVVNDTDLLKYYLEDGTLTDSYEIIDFMDDVHEVLEKGGEVYIDFTTSGDRYIMCFDLLTFTEVNRTLRANIDDYGYNYHVWNWICWEINDISYWFYGYSYSASSSDANQQQSMFKGNFDEILPYTGYGVYSFGHGYTGNTYTGTWYHNIYMFNTSDSSTTTFGRGVGATSDHRSEYSYSTVYWNGTHFVLGAYYGRSAVYLGGGSSMGVNNWGGREDAFNIQSMFDEDGNSYSTMGKFSIRGKLGAETITETALSNNKLSYFWDLEEKVFGYNDWWGSTCGTGFYQATNTIASGFIGGWSVFNINYEPFMRSDIRRIGRVAFGHYETYTGYDNYYIGYVNQSDKVPISERIVLATGNDIVSSFDYDDVVECYIYEATKNLIATFTRENDTTLYVLRNLIDRDELASGGYLTPTLQFISANLYTIVGGEKVASDGWLYMGEVYQLEAVIQNMTYYYMTLDDGENTAKFYFENSTKSLNVTCSDEFVAGLVHASVELINETSNRYNCEWRFILDKNIGDVPQNTTITYYGENTIESKTVSGTAITGLKIYNLGGWVSYELDVSSGKITGGDALEVYDSNSTGTGAYVDVIYRRLQHVHLEWMMDIGDNDCFDVDENSGEIHMGIQYKTPENTWVDGWYFKLSIVNGAIDPSGGGIGKAWIVPYVTWYARDSDGIVSAIKNDILSTYPECGDDVNNEISNAQFIVDLWFNTMNSSTTIGGRINSKYYGMDEGGWMLWTNWNPVRFNVTESMFFYDLLDEDGNVMQPIDIDVMKFWVRVIKAGSGSGSCESHTWSIRNPEFSKSLADDRMEALNTPEGIDTLVIDMPSGGFLQPLTKAIQGIGRVMTTAMFNMIKMLLGAIDSILVNILNSPVSMTQMINWIMIRASFVGDWLATVVEYASQVLTVFTSMVTTILRVMSWTITAISWVLVYVVGFPIHFLNMIYAVLTGGTWTMGAFYIDFASQGDLVSGLMQLAPYGVGFAFTVWLIFGNIEMKGDVDEAGMPKRIHQVFVWFKSIYEDIFWIFTSMHNKIIELYNFIRSHIPYLGGSGGREA